VNGGNGGDPDTGPELIAAWRKLTACLLLGAIAADDFDTAVSAMHQTVDSFPVEDAKIGSYDALALASADYARQAYAILHGVVGEGE
jgi:hypothetical protein